MRCGRDLLHLLILVTLLLSHCCGMLRTKAGQPANLRTLLNTASYTLAGPPSFNQRLYVPFDPDFGLKARPSFTARYGIHGSWLIDALGRGYTRRQLVYYGAISP